MVIFLYSFQKSLVSLSI